MTSRWFRDRDGKVFTVVPLTRARAAQHADELLSIHNTIPFQHWTRADLLADRDESRVYHGKWEISRIALDETGCPLAFNVGFEREPDGVYYREACVYLHRLAVAPACRGRYVGALLHAETISCVFERGMRILRADGAFAVFGQANEVPDAAKLLAFYRDIGLEPVGRKPYDDRVDLILRLTRASFLGSRHRDLHARQLIPDR